MTLEQLFQECLARPGSPLHTNDKDDFTVACNSIREFLGSQGRTLADADVLELAVTGWADGYFEYIFNHRTPNKAKGGRERTEDEKLRWASRYLKCLRKVVNLAIRHGLLPNVDCLDGIGRLPGFGRRQGVEEPDSAAGTLRKLAFRNRARGEFDVDDLYLLGLYCGGLELDELRRLVPGTIDRATRLVHLGWAGTDVKVSGSVLDTLVECARTPQWHKATPTSVSVAMERAGLRLYRGRSVFADWLRYAAERHLDGATVRRLAALRLAPGKTCPADLQQAIQKVTDGLATACNRYRKQWYCLVTRRGTAAERYRELADSCRDREGALPGFAQRRSDFYFIESAGRKVPRGAGHTLASVLRRHLFVCLYAHETELLRRQLQGVSFLRERKGSRTCATIPYAEMYRLQLVLESLRGTGAVLRLEDEEVSRAVDATPLAPKERVMIIRPGYEGYEAEVVKAGAEDRYTVRFPHLNWNVVMTDVPRALIRRL